MEHDKRHQWNDPHPHNCPSRICWDAKKKNTYAQFNVRFISYFFYFHFSTCNGIAVDHLNHNAQWQRIINTLWTTLTKTECVKCTQIDPFSSPAAPVSLAKCSSRNFWGKFFGQNIYWLLAHWLDYMINRECVCCFRTCPEIEKLYLLVRTKKGKKPKDRLHDIFDNAVNWIKLIFTINIRWAGSRSMHAGLWPLTLCHRNEPIAWNALLRYQIVEFNEKKPWRKKCIIIYKMMVVLNVMCYTEPLTN